MKVLILDDDSERGRLFQRALIGHSVTVVRTAPEAIDLLAREGWDATSLDHDLGDEQMAASGPGTGWEVAKWLADHPDRIPPVVIIHSFNPPGRDRMKALLPGAIVAPGWWTLGRWPLEA